VVLKCGVFKVQCLTLDRVLLVALKCGVFSGVEVLCVQDAMPDIGQCCLVALKCGVFSVLCLTLDSVV